MVSPEQAFLSKCGVEHKGSLCVAQLSDELVQVIDPAFSHLECIAWLKKGTMGGSVKTKIHTPDGSLHHPTIYGKPFIRAAYEHFLDTGKSVDRFMGIWRAKQDECTDEPSTNWLQFRTYIAQQEQIMQETLHKAALSTWTGGVSASLGFNCVESVTIDYDHPWYGEVVTAVFKKHS